ncbi:MAG: hypothetical protein P1U74_09275 [Legionellaceae bacterium]|nr:hypothetical protein [Legionellaceae bacterium]
MITQTEFLDATKSFNKLLTRAQTSNISDKKDLENIYIVNKKVADAVLEYISSQAKGNTEIKKRSKNLVSLFWSFKTAASKDSLHKDIIITKIFIEMNKSNKDLTTSTIRPEIFLNNFFEHINNNKFLSDLEQDHSQRRLNLLPMYFLIGLFLATSVSCIIPGFIYGQILPLIIGFSNLYFTLSITSVTAFVLYPTPWQHLNACCKDMNCQIINDNGKWKIEGLTKLESRDDATLETGQVVAL